MPCEVKKKISKKIKKLLTNKRKHVIIVIQGKESQRSQTTKNFKKVKKVLDKTKALCYNNNVR